MHCPCGGQQRTGNPDEPPCPRCGGSGYLYEPDRDARPGHSPVPPSGGISDAVAGGLGRAQGWLLVQLVLSVAPFVVALVIINDRLYAFAPAWRRGLEALPGDGLVATTIDGPARPGVVAAIVGGCALAAIVVLVITRRRRVRRLGGRGDVAVLHLLGVALTTVVLVGIPATYQATAIAAGADLRSAAPDPSLTGPVPTALAIAAVLLLSWVATNRLIRRRGRSAPEPWPGTPPFNPHAPRVPDTWPPPPPPG